jgi:geranylgeranyl diphosphate synthase type I
MRATAVRTRPPADDVLTSCAALTEPALRAAVEALPRALHPMTGYHRVRAAAGPEAGGSPAGRDAAIRSALALLSCAVVSGRPEPAVPAAVAVELVHDFSLLLDEEADGRARPRRPTAWTVVGTGPAVLAGDALLTRALEVLAAAPPAAGRLLTGAVQELVDGRAADLALARRGAVTPAECLATAGATTGALLGAACALGAMLGGAGPERVRDMDRFGRHLGVALRIGDDLLGIRAVPTVAGRPGPHDLRRRRTSLPVVAALASGTPAGRELRDLHDRAGELTGRDLARAAEMVERGGGRQWCTDRADELLRRALALLPEGPGPAGAAAHLRHVAELVARRDR